MLNGLKIGPKLIGGFLIVALVAAVIGIIGTINIKDVDSKDTMLYEKAAVPLKDLVVIGMEFQKVRTLLWEVINATNEETFDERVKEIDEARNLITEAQDDFEKNINDEKLKKEFDEFKKSRVIFGEDIDKVIELAKMNKIKEAEDFILNDLDKTAGEEEIQIDSMETELNRFAKEVSDNNTKTANAASMIMILSLIFGVIIAITLGVFITLSITKPVNTVVQAARKIAEEDLANLADVLNAASSGDFSKLPEIKTQELTIKSKDEVGILATTFNQMIAKFNVSGKAIEQFINAVKALTVDANMLSKAAVDGKLDTRADASKHNGDFRKIVQGVNDTLDAVIGPLNVAAEYVDRISKGDIPQRITDTYHGDFNEIKNNLNQCIDAVNALVTDANLLSNAAVEGKLATRADASKHTGDFRKIVQGVDDCLDSVIGPLNVAAKYVDDISKGKIPAKITDNYNGDFNTIKNNLNQCIEAVNMLVTDANMLAQAGIDGRLATRADATKHNGDFRKIVEGVNGTLDAVITPINEAQSVLEKVAARDLTARVCGEYNGDMAKIKIAINSAVDNLDKALQQVTEATEQVTSASGQISSGSQSLAQGANEQASSLEEVSSSLEEMESMTKQNAGNANQAKGLAAESDSNAKSGAEAMDRMSNAINRIKESSDQTAKIVKTIDEIAMQTNLLALNAAVEAARAGEAGRGFAVVAEEVRNLAQRSAQAAKNTADMITESVKNADDGVKIATEVSQSFETIAGSAKKVNDLIAEIAAASQEQSAGIEQINTAVAQMDKVTQQNAANSEESASAAEELSSQAEELKNMIAQFALSHSVMSVSTSRRPVVTQTVAHAPVKEKHNLKAIGKKPLGKTTSIKPEDIIPLDDDALKEF
jgi:methyl-accepting chemotaxis protein